MSQEYFSSVNLSCPQFLLVPLWPIRPNGGCWCSRGMECPSPGKHPINGHWADDIYTPPEWQHLGWRSLHPDGVSQALERLTQLYGSEFRPNWGHTPWNGGALVVDVDVKGKGIGWNAIGKYAPEVLDLTNPDRPPMVQTPSYVEGVNGARVHGGHLFFAGRADLEGQGKRSLNGVGLELFTGYQSQTQLVMPGSEVALGTYQWHPDFPWKTPLPPIPQALLDLFFSGSEAIVSAGTHGQECPWTYDELAAVPELDAFDIPEPIRREILDAAPPEGDRSDWVHHVALGLRGFTELDALQITAILSNEAYGVAAKAAGERGFGAGKWRSRAQWVWSYQVAPFSWEPEEKKACQEQWRAGWKPQVEEMFEHIGGVSWGNGVDKENGESAYTLPPTPQIPEFQRLPPAAESRRKGLPMYDGNDLVDHFVVIENPGSIVGYLGESVHRGLTYSFTTARQMLRKKETHVGKSASEPSFEFFQERSKRVNGITYVPGGETIVREGPIERFNTWTGYAYPNPHEDIDSAWKTAHKHTKLYNAIHRIAQGLTHTTGDPVKDAEREQWWLIWHARRVWAPHQRTREHAVHICQEEGAGRGTWIAVFEQVLGPKNVGTADNLAALTADYAGDLREKLLVTVEEAAYGSHHIPRGKYEDLKALLTATTVTVDRKYQAKYDIPSATGYLLCSNRLNPLRIADNARRFRFFLLPWDKANNPEPPTTSWALSTVHEYLDSWEEEDKEVLAEVFWAYWMIVRDTLGLILPQNFIDDRAAMETAVPQSAADHTVSYARVHYAGATQLWDEAGITRVTSQQMIQMMGVHARLEGLESVFTPIGDIEPATAREWEREVRRSARSGYAWVSSQSREKHGNEIPSLCRWLGGRKFSPTRYQARLEPGGIDAPLCPCEDTRAELFRAEKALIEHGTTSLRGKLHGSEDVTEVLQTAVECGVDLNGLGALLIKSPLVG